MGELVENWVAVPGWVSLTSESAEYWAAKMIGQAVLASPGIKDRAGWIRRTWVEDGGVMAEIEIDPAAHDEAFERHLESAIA